MSDFGSTLIALAGVLAVGYANNFLAEDYKRFRTARAFAGALVGELSAHREASRHIESRLGEFIRAAKAGQRLLTLREFPTPTDPIYEEGVGNIGLLGSKFAQDVAYTYQNIRAFRLALSIISKDHSNMGQNELVNRLEACQEAFARAEERGLILLPKLELFSNEKYWDHLKVVVKSSKIW